MRHFNMEIRLFDLEKDYDEVSSWWTKQKWPVIPSEFLSPTGFIAIDGDDKVAVTWVYRTDSPIYIMEWLVGNPDVSHEKRKQGIEGVINTSSIYAKESGASQLFTMIRNDRLSEKLKDLDFKETDKEMTHFIRSL